ncbi:MAG: YvcK family protein [Candidatus Nealsonbacteria bacterium]|nr:YvcK family protein [Candidatus Nealsonbacteria bacterium]
MSNSLEKKIVCLGGGNAMPRAILSELKKHPVSISAICAMLDSGGSAGRLRKDYKIISPGDIRRAFLALANTSPAVENLFNFRFEGGDLKGHNFANLFITALELSTNDYEKTIREIKRILNIKHEVLPATLDKSHLYAVLKNGKIISGETNIDIPKHNGSLKIKRVFLKPKARAYPKALDAIRKADIIVIGPGDLYSSLAQILLTEGTAEAIKKSKAKKVYICNLMTKYGETNDYTVEEFAEKIEGLIGKSLDYVIYNNKVNIESRVKEYRKKNKELLGLVKFGSKLDKNKFIGVNVITSSGDIIHDPKKLTKIILKI